jgi:acyl-CoA synthetase (AMP-forming)/AMP-acid ligase II
MNLRTTLSVSPWVSSDRPALVTADCSLTFRQLFDAAQAITPNLTRPGRDGRSLVVLAVGNSAAFAVAWLGLVRHGAAVALLSPSSGRAEWMSIESALGPLQLVATEETAEQFGVAGRQRNRLEASGPCSGLFLFHPDGECRDAPPGVDLVKFTSGSTGLPKAIGLSADNIRAESDNVRRTLAIEPGDRILAPVPLSHSYGFDLGFLQMLFHGAQLEVESQFIPKRILRKLAGGEADIFLGVPAMYRFLLEAAPADRHRSLSCRYLLSCSAPLAPDLIAEFHTRFGAVICQHYGASEAGAVTNHVTAEVLSRPRSVGRAVSGVTLSIVDEQGKAVPSGTPGEIEIRSDAVSGGYLMGGADRSPFRAGAFRMGDQGVLDNDGFLEVLGRMDDLINVGGLKVSPLEVSQVLENHPDVREAVAFAVPDRVGGEVVEAVVVLRGRASEEELLRHCRGRLAEHKVPRRLVFRSMIPKGPTGKVIRGRFGESA